MDNDTKDKRIRPAGCSKALPRPDLNVLGRLYIGHLMTLYGLSQSTINKHLRQGLLPPADGVIAGRRYWKTWTIKNDLSK